MVSNHDSRSPFFSLFSLTYSKAIISSCFHYQIAGANKRYRLRQEYFRRAGELDRAAVILDRLAVELGYERQRQRRRQLPPVQPAGHLAF